MYQSSVMKYCSVLLVSVLACLYSTAQTSGNDSIAPTDYSVRKTSGNELLYQLDYLNKEGSTAIIVNNKLAFDFSVQKELVQRQEDIIRFDILKDVAAYKERFKLQDKIQTVIAYTVNKKLYKQLKKMKK